MGRLPTMLVSLLLGQEIGFVTKYYGSNVIKPFEICSYHERNNEYYETVVFVGRQITLV